MITEKIRKIIFARIFEALPLDFRCKKNYRGLVISDVINPPIVAH